MTRHHEILWEWNSLYVQFKRRTEQSVWNALLEILVDLVLTE
ncbi:MAG: hypothetical protein ABF506_07895 [Zymomonas mobilis]